KEEIIFFLNKCLLGIQLNDRKQPTLTQFFHPSISSIYHSILEMSRSPKIEKLNSGRFLKTEKANPCISQRFAFSHRSKKWLWFGTQHFAGDIQVNYFIAQLF